MCIANRTPTPFWSMSTIFLLFAWSIAGFSQTPAQLRAGKLLKGINVGSVGQNVEPECCQTVDEVARLQALGFDHVRLGVFLSSVCDCRTTGDLQATQVDRVFARIKTFTDSKMPVIVTVRLKNPKGELEFDLQEEGFGQRLEKFWTLFAIKLKQLPDDLVFPEVLNEPYEKPQGDELKLIQDWVKTKQPNLIKAIHDNAGPKTVIATGARGSTPYGLFWLSLEKLDDDVIYSFHYYNPRPFAFDGKGHYPSPLYPLLLQSINPGDDNLLRGELYDQNYIAEFSYWDQKRIKAELDAVHDWSKSHNVAVICDEFGVRKTADGSTTDEHLIERRQWIDNVRSQLVKDGIGWTFWDYSDCQQKLEPCAHDHFGLLKGDGTEDLDVEQALGLKRK